VNILAFDTSSDILSICVEKGSHIYEVDRLIGLKHSELLSPLIGELLEEAELTLKDLDLISCARGPGSFTGLRIGMATAKGLSVGAEVPLVSVPTLDFVAFGYDYFDGVVLPLLDAKKKCYYTALYRKGKRISEYLDIPKDALVELVGTTEKVLLTGADVEIFKASGLPETWNVDPLARQGRSQALLNLGKVTFQKSGPDPDNLGPLYLRRSEAEISREKKEIKE
jgi:tRNA threonylcarbamoyladenosine biosynthesis protein TsaB